MADYRFTYACGRDITNEQLEETATLFRENYGVWSPQTTRAGQPVSLSPERLRQQYLPSTADTTYARVESNNKLVGYAFACRWQYQDLKVCWITQLCIHKDFRDLHLATTLLALLRKDTDHIFGIMSSHPAACMAATKSFTSCLQNPYVELDFIAAHAEEVIKSSPIEYIRDAKLHGKIFRDKNSPMVCGVDTGFFVDHTEPNKVLREIQEYGGDSGWKLGELLEGHEFFLLLRPK